MRRRYDRRRMDLFGEEEADPMSGVGNLADVMLVLAVGIMLALVINWHISVTGNQVTSVDSGQMHEVDTSDIESLNEDEDSGKTTENLEEKGTVYVDRNTGKMYLVEPK